MKEIKLDKFIESEENRDISLKVKNETYEFRTSAWNTIKIKEIVYDKSLKDSERIEKILRITFAEQVVSDILKHGSRVIEEIALVIVASNLGFEPNKFKEVMGSDKGKELAKEMAAIMTLSEKIEN